MQSTATNNRKADLISFMCLGSVLIYSYLSMLASNIELKGSVISIIKESRRYIKLSGFS